MSDLTAQLAAAQAAMVKYREWWNETKVEYPAFFRNFAPPELPDGTTALDATVAAATDAAVQEMLLVKQNRDRDIAAATKPLVDALKKLAMLALQSKRYTDDPDYRDATDAALAQVNKPKP